GFLVRAVPGGDAGVRQAVPRGAGPGGGVPGYRGEGLGAGRAGVLREPEDQLSQPVRPERPDRAGVPRLPAERDPVPDRLRPAGPGGRGAPGYPAARRPRAGDRPVGGRAVSVTAALIPALVLAAPGAGLTGPGLAGSELAAAGVGQTFAHTVTDGPLL